MEGVTLTIQPGVTVRFDSHKALQIDGELIAVGTSASPITFTSNVGTNPGDWDYIVFSDSSVDAVYDIGTGVYQSGSTLQYVVIEYAGGASVDNNGALRLDAAAPFITYTTIRHNASAGIRGFNSPVTLKMTHNTIMDNAGTGISVAGATYVEITDSTIVANANLLYSWGGGISVASGSGATTSLISRNVIRGNTAAVDGSGIDLRGGSSTISDNVITENAIADCDTCWDRSVLLAEGEGTIRNNLIAYNFTGGIVGSPDTIVENIIIHNQGRAMNLVWWDWGSWTISHNIISDNTTRLEVGAVRLGNYGVANFSYNSILRNTALDNAALVYEVSDEGSTISANTIVGNVNQSAPGNLRAVSIQGHPTFNDNNIYNNTGYALYYLSPQGSANLNAENNWWGTSSSPAIQALIHDWFDEPTVGIVDYSPYRTAHNLAAPVSPPTGLNVTSGLTSIDLSWAANPESDVTGYKVYYDVDATYPYSGTGADQGDSPIDVGNVHSVTLTGLPVGKYYLSVTAYDAGADGAHDQTDGNESWFAVDATGMIGEAPQAEFSATPTSGIAPLDVNFTNESTGLYDTCEWDFGDGSTSSSCSDPTHTYTTTGVVTVTLTVDGDLGPSTRVRASYISVYTPVQADFTGLPTSGLAPLEVTFTNQSTGDYATCAWAFGDGDSSADCTDPSYTYTSAGTYTVTLTVSMLGGSALLPGGTDTITRTRYITVTEPSLQVDFVGAPRSGNAPLAVQFASTVTGTVTAYAWNFGDGDIADTPNPTHTYQSAGNFGVTLVVTGLGGTASASKPGYITVNAPPGAPTATFSADVVSGTAPLKVTFTAVTSGTVEQWHWDFGDGGAAFTGPVISHTYIITGTFDVSLTVSNTYSSFIVSKPRYITVRRKTERFV
ncbi:MAG: PKD domain-containing protein, partial [Methanoregulaceae archaeon]|nr:PKD domain-containing protein [Methanoregulaceae archaeon]